MSVNGDPLCDEARLDPAAITTKDRSFVPVMVTGVSDPDGDPVTITVLAVEHDEPRRGRGTLGICPDATDLGEGAALVRAERRKTGRGRIYRLAFVAVDDRGGSCLGSASTCVPRKASDPRCEGSDATVDATLPTCTGACASLCRVEAMLGRPLCSGDELPGGFAHRLVKARRLLELAAKGDRAGPRRTARAVRRLDQLVGRVERGRGGRPSAACEAEISAVVTTAVGDLRAVVF